MNTIKPDYLNGWTYKPEFAKADMYTTNTAQRNIADEIARRIKQIERGHEVKMYGFDFNDLSKDLEELGIELHTIRSSAGEVGCEIEGYFRPEVYKAHNAREKLTPVHPVGPKPVPKKVIFSGPATTILWKDSTKTTVKCQRHDIWDKDVGVAMCYLKKLLGNEGNFNNIFREAMKVSETQEVKK